MKGNKLFYGDIEDLFNKAFYLLNSVRLDKCDENYLLLLETDHSHNKKARYDYEATSKYDYKVALSIFQEILNRNSKHILSLEMSGICNYRLGNYSESIEDYSKAIELEPKLLFAYSKLGEVKLDILVKDYKGAIKDFSKAIELDNKFAEAYNNRGIAKYRSNDYNGAIEDYSKAIELDELDCAIAYSNRGMAKCQLNDYNGAVEDCFKAIELDAKNRMTLSVLYHVRSFFKNDIVAIEDFSKIIELTPQNKFAYYERGTVKGYLKDYEGAIEDFSKVIEFSPKDTEAYKLRGEIKMYNLNNYEGAIEDYSKVIELDPKDSVAYSRRGSARDFLNDKEGAIEDFTKAIELNQDTEAYFFIESIRNDLKDYKGIVEDFTKAIEFNSKDSYAYAKRGEAKYELKDYKGAIEDLSKAIESPVKYAWMYLSRGKAKEMDGDLKGATLDKLKYEELEKNKYKQSHEQNTRISKKQQLINELFELIKSYNSSIKEYFEDLQSMPTPNYYNNRSNYYASAWGGMGGTYPRNNAAQRNRNRIMYEQNRHFIEEKEDIKCRIGTLKVKKDLLKQTLNYLKSQNLIPEELNSKFHRFDDYFNDYENELFDTIVKYLEFRNLNKNE